MDLEIWINTLDIVEDGEDFGGSLIDIEAVQRSILPGVIVGVC